MGNLLKTEEKEPKSRLAKVDLAAAELKITRDKLKNHQKKLESSIGSLQKCIIDCIRNKKKEQALLFLRKQKSVEKSALSIQNELLNIDYLVLNIENSQVQQKVFKALEEGNSILKQINKEVTLEDVDKLMADTEEAIEYQHEVGLALSRQGIDEEDCLEQLEKLEVSLIDLPSVPSRPLISESSKKKSKLLIESPLYTCLILSPKTPVPTLT